MSKRKEVTSMEKLTHGYEKFIKGKGLKDGGKTSFDKAIKKATKIKQRGSK